MYSRIKGTTIKDTKEAVNYAGDGGKQVDKELKRVRNSCGANSARKWPRPMPRGTAISSDTNRGDERAVNEGQRTELIENRIPDGGAEKLKPNLCRGQDGALPQLKKRGAR